MFVDVRETSLGTITGLARGVERASV